MEKPGDFSEHAQRKLLLLCIFGNFLYFSKLLSYALIKFLEENTVIFTTFISSHVLRGILCYL